VGNREKVGNGEQGVGNGEGLKDGKWGKVKGWEMEKG
jgi:hypothetical protein